MPITFSANLLENYQNKAKLETEKNITKKADAPVQELNAANTKKTQKLALSLGGLAVLGIAAISSHKIYKCHKIKQNIQNTIIEFKENFGEFEDISPIITKLKNGKTKIELNNIETSPDGYKNILICDKNGKFEKRVAFLTEPDSGAKGYITCNYMVGEPNYKKYKSVFKLDADNNGTPGSMTFIVNENSSTGKRTTGVILKQNNNEGVIRVHTQVDTDTLSNLIIDTGLFDENHKVKFINRTITNDPDNPCSECIKFEPKHKPLKFNIEEIEKYYDNETIDKLQNFQEKHLDKIMSMLDSINDK